MGKNKSLGNAQRNSTLKRKQEDGGRIEAESSHEKKQVRIIFLSINRPITPVLLLLVITAQA
jgi:hypothetical protein